MLSFVLLSAVFISKLSIDPLSEYVTNLQQLSKETLHELNLPVSTINTNAQMLKKNLIDTKSLKRLQRIETACEMLQERYNELDYMIKVQSEKDIKEAFHLDELLQKRVDFFSSFYPQVEFVTQLESTKIVNDKIGVAKVVDNIIQNGVKYSTTKKQIDITLQDNILSIKDYGCGMKEVELLKIFDTYYQSNKNMQGFGIGLSMVKRFCDTHNIGLHFESQVDIGTTVKLNFKEKN